MKSRKLVICSSVALLQLLVGGSLLLSGCATAEEDRLPPGAYVDPKTKEAPPANTPDIVTPEQAQTTTEFTPIEPVPYTPAPKKHSQSFSEEQKSHTVKKGESFWSIALIYGISMEDIAAANSSVNPRKLHVGQKLVIPAHGKAIKKSGKTTSKSVAPATAKRTKKTSVTLESNDGKYTVRKGDSLARIASKFHIKTAELAAANNISIEKPLQIGQKLVIPKAGQKSTKAAPANTAATKVKKTETAAKPEAKTATDDTAAAPAVPAAGDDATVPVPEAPLSTAPAAPIASPDAVNAVSKDATPTAAPAVPGAASSAYTAEINEDTTLDALAKRFGFGVAELRKLNPEIPADGKVRAGSVIKLP